MFIDECSFKLILHKINMIVMSMHTDAPAEVILLKTQWQIFKNLLFM